MPTLPSQPKPVPGAARYYAFGLEVFMVEPGGYTTGIQTYRTEGTALDGAKKWQEKENAAVTKEAARVAKLAK